MNRVVRISRRARFLVRAPSVEISFRREPPEHSDRLQSSLAGGFEVRRSVTDEYRVLTLDAKLFQYLLNSRVLPSWILATGKKRLEEGLRLGRQHTSDAPTRLAGHCSHEETILAQLVDRRDHLIEDADPLRLCRESRVVLSFVHVPSVRDACVLEGLMWSL